MKEKKEKKEKKVEQSTTPGAPETATVISTKADLKSYLLAIRDRLEDESAAAIYAGIAMNHMMTLPEIDSYLDQENKELARDIWLRIKQSGLQVRNPALLFGADADPAPLAK